jgi:hypothetical protein
MRTSEHLQDLHHIEPSKIREGSKRVRADSNPHQYIPTLSEHGDPKAFKKPQAAAWISLIISDQITIFSAISVGIKQPTWRGDTECDISQNGIAD